MKSRLLKLILFDAAGTLFHLPKGVGFHYALVGRQLGLKMDAAALDRSFTKVWKEIPARPMTGEPREADDKGWWRELVDRVLDATAPDMRELDRDNFFEIAYDHFAEAGVWEVYPEVFDVLRELHDARYSLSVVSNFDGRLRMILHHLGLSKFFRHVIISSEVGADKPAPLIFLRALELGGAQPNECLHVGDDPVRDWEGATAVGLSVFRLKRPETTLRDLFQIL